MPGRFSGSVPLEDLIAVRAAIGAVAISFRLSLVRCANSRVRVASMLHGIPGNGSEREDFCGFPAQRVAQSQTQLGPPRGGPKSLYSLANLVVAGVGFEPTTFRL